MQTIVNLGTGGADLNGQNGSTTSADSNDALFLDWPGDNGGNYVYLPGVAGNYLSVPDEAALDITGDIDIRVRVAMDDWTPAAGAVLAAKEQTSTTESWRFTISGTGALGLRFSATGTGATDTGVSTASVSLADGLTGWVRVTLDVDNGASGRDFKFYTSDDGVTWTQLGSTVTQAGASSIYASTSPIEIGSVRGGAALPLAAKVYRAQVLDGINGTTVLDVDCSQISSGADTSFTAPTGQTVTINRSTSGRKSVAVVSPVWLFGTDDYMEVADNALLNFGASDSFTVLAVVRQWANTVSTGRYLSKLSASAGNAGYHIYTGGTSDANMQVSDGSNSANVKAVMSLGSVSILAYTVDRSSQTLTPYLNGSSGTTASTSAVGNLGNGLTAKVGRVTDAAVAYSAMELLALASFRRTLTADEISQLSTYYSNRWS